MKYRISLLALCLLAFILRLHLLEELSLLDDEAIAQSRYVQQPVHHILAHYTPNNHWLASLLGHLMGQLGHHRFLLRWPSVLFGTLSTPLMGLVAYQLFKNRRDSFVGALLLCLSAFHIQWSQQFRGYSALLFFALLAAFFLYRALQTGRNRCWAYLLLAASLATASHLYGVLMLINIVAIGGCWTGYQLLTKQTSPSQHKWPLAILILSLPLIAYLTWFAKTQVIDLNHALPDVSFTRLIQYQWLAFKPTLTDIQDFLKEIALAYTAQDDERLALALFWGLAITGVTLSWRRFSRPAIFLALWLILPLLIVIAVELVIAGFFVFDRYLIFTLPAWLLLAGRALAAGSDRLAAQVYHREWYQENRKRAQAAISMSLLLLSLCYLGLRNASAAQNYFLERAGRDWRSAAAYLAGRVAAADIIVCKQLPHRWPPRRLDLGDQCTKELAYRLAELGLAARFPIKQLEIIATLNTGLQFKNQAATPGAVWLVIWGEDVPQATTVHKQALHRSFSPPRSRGLATQLHSALMAISFNRLDDVTIFKAGTEPALVANLGQALSHLSHLDTVSPDRFDYDLRLAQILAYQGRIAEARLLLDRAGEFLEADSRALLETEQAVNTIAANLNQASPAKIQKLGIDFGRPPALQLAGFNLPEAALQPGQTMPVTFFWETLAPLSADYTIFLHLRNPANETVAQLDFRPFEGAYPTYQWPSGAEIQESRFWTLPANLPPGVYALRLGLYQSQALTPLPISGHPAGENAALLGYVRVIN